jgi:hypothetical protein
MRIAAGAERDRPRRGSRQGAQQLGQADQVVGRYRQREGQPTRAVLRIRGLQN